MFLFFFTKVKYRKKKKHKNTAGPINFILKKAYRGLQHQKRVNNYQTLVSEMRVTQYCCILCNTAATGKVFRVK